MSIDVGGVAAAGRFGLGDGLSVARIGYGTMQLPGPGVWGPPKDRGAALAVLRRAVDLGVDHIDTSDFYGPHVANELVAEALHPYPAHLVIATKIGVGRDPGGGWIPDAGPDSLRRQVHDNLRRLRRERLDVVYLRVGGDGLLPDSGMDLDVQLDVLAGLRDAGLIRHVGLSGATRAQLERATAALPIVAVQNRYNLVDRSGADLLAACTDRGIAFVPYFPLAAGDVLDSAAMRRATARTGASAPQVALAWLLALSPVVLAIPGTSSVAHLEENLRAAAVRLTPEEVAALSAAAPASYALIDYLMSREAAERGR